MGFLQLPSPGKPVAARLCQESRQLVPGEPLLQQRPVEGLGPCSLPPLLPAPVSAFGRNGVRFPVSATCCWSSRLGGLLL